MSHDDRKWNKRVHHESLAALHIQRRHKIDKDDRCRKKRWLAKELLVGPDLAWLMYVDWTLLGQVELAGLSWGIQTMPLSGPAYYALRIFFGLVEGDFKFVCNWKTICTCLFHNMWFHKVSWELKVNWGVRLYARWLRFCWTCYFPMSMNIEIQNQQITCKSCHSLVLAYCKLLFLVEVKRVGCSIIFTRITITKPPQSLSLQIKQEVLILWKKKLCFDVLTQDPRRT